MMLRPDSYTIGLQSSGRRSFACKSDSMGCKLRRGGSSVSTTAFEVKVGNAIIVVRAGFDPELLGGIVRALGHAE